MNTRLSKLQTRRIDPSIKASLLNEVYGRIQEDDAVKYALGAMQPIDPEYTKNTYAESARVENQLKDGLTSAGIEVEFKHQGSVTSDTHIKAHSDIDLLTLHLRFFVVEPPLTPQYPYKGDPIDDLQVLRSTSTRVLKGAFPTATISDSNPKCLSVEGGSLRRKIDVIPSNWWNTVDYHNTSLPYYRGINIFDADQAIRIPNKPFLHNKRIDDRDAAVGGSLRKVIRLLKSLKYDADYDLRLSSYEIASVSYHMGDQMLKVPYGQDLLLVSNTRDYLKTLIDSPQTRTTLKTPNDMETIFRSGDGGLTGIKQMHAEVSSLANDIQMGLARSFKKLETARVTY